MSGEGLRAWAGGAGKVKCLALVPQQAPGGAQAVLIFAFLAKTLSKRDQRS